jgi:HAD superfamily hydrolase (TIGR01549 family)
MRTAPVLRIPIFDLDGTLVDSDEALAAAFVALGVPREEVTFGHVLADECARLGVDVQEYLDHYDPSAVGPFPDVVELLAQLPRWAICSNKRPESGLAELERLGWEPDVALFSNAFDGPKSLGPVLDAMGLDPDHAVFVGDTDHDRSIAREAGVLFGLAGWNARATPQPGDIVLAQPSDVLDLCRAMVSQTTAE